MTWSITKVNRKTKKEEKIPKETHTHTQKLKARGVKKKESKGRVPISWALRTTYKKPFPCLS